MRKDSEFLHDQWTCDVQTHVNKSKRRQLFITETSTDITLWFSLQKYKTISNFLSMEFYMEIICL